MIMICGIFFISYWIILVFVNIYVFLYGKKNTKMMYMEMFKTNISVGFPGGLVTKKPPGIAGDMGSIPGPGRSHMP